MGTRLARLISFALPFFLAAPIAEAATTPDVPGYVTSIWRARDGAPGDIRAMAQTGDGWLWLGTSAGLFRFDGRTFAAHDLLPEDFPGPRVVDDLAASPDGSLWVTYGRSTVVGLAPDGMTVLRPEGLPAEGVGGVAIDGNGRVLATAGEQIFELVGNRWVLCQAPNWVLPKGAIDSVVLDADGGIVANTSEGVFHLAPGTTTFARVSGIGGAEDEILINGGDGRIWRTRRGALEPVPGVRAGKADAGRGSTIVASDARGGYWSMIQGCVALCLRRDGVNPAKGSMGETELDVFPRGRDGLTAMTLLSDAAGNVWASGKEGLVRFHPTEVKTVNLGYEAFYFSVVPMGDGTTVVGSDSNWKGDNLLRFSPDGRRLLSDGIRTNTMAQWSEDTVLHVARSGPLSLLVGDKLVPWSARPPALETAYVQFAMPDGTGRAWVGVQDKGLYVVTPTSWTRMGAGDGFPLPSPRVGEMVGPGHAWFGYVDGKVLAVEHGGAVKGGLYETGLGTVAAILPGSPLLVGGERGIAWFDGRMFHALTPRLPDALRGVTGLARTRDGAVWANGRAGLVRIDAQALADAVRGTNRDVPFRIVTDEDGLAGRAQQSRGLSSLSVDARGQLWAAGALGLATIDPDAVRAPAAVRPVILSVSSEHRGTLTANSATLAPDDNTLGVTFTGLSLTDPAHMQFRYRLKGADDTWRMSEVPGMVKYADLAPGSYQFELQARNTEGDWSPVTTSPTVVRIPAFTETGLFRWLIVAACLVVLFAAYEVRIRMLRKRHIERINAKLAERDRIARELHDSILQGLQAIAIRLSAWEIDTGIPETMRARVKALSRQMAGIVLEGRARVVALRSVGQGSMSLSNALRLIGEDHQEGSTVAFDLVVLGEETELPDDIQVPVLDILREAVHNAFLHAKAHAIQVTLDFSTTTFKAHVIDDGRGLPVEVRDAGRRPGHWGLVIMRERADGIDASFDITTSPTGTSVRLAVRVPVEKAAGKLRRTAS
jgi:signal transduction histidine kinase